MSLTAMPGCEIDDAEIRWEGRICADHHTDKCSDCSDAGALTLDPTTNDPHLNALVIYLVDQAHEAIEWIKLDGKRFATPHPSDDMEHWDFLVARLTRMLRDYRRRWPA